MERTLALAVLAAMAVVGCAGERGTPERGAGTERDEVCVDRDGDGKGRGCARGADCDDHDPALFEGCLRCATPAEGCACQPGTAAQSCFLDKTEDEHGAIMCHEGSRYCREGLWSACEDVHSYPLPERTQQTAVIDEDAGPVQCNDCAVNCFRITDTLVPLDGGLTDANSDGIDWVPGGGLTLGEIPDAGVDGGEPADAGECVLGVTPDIDCDGIPDGFDPYPDDPPFDTANPTIFLDVAPGETGVGEIDISFYLNSADIYLLMDQSASMSGERDNLVENVTGDAVTGNPAIDLISCTLLQGCCDELSGASQAECQDVVDAGDSATCDAAGPTYCAGQEYLMDCADADFDRVPDNHVKSQGLVGAVRCLIRDSRFGVGFHRELPFSGYAPNDQIAFGHYQDVTDDLANVFVATERLHNVGNYDWPEDSMVALHSLVTGSGMYFGTTKRGVPPRLDCPGATWGYPCFRDDAIPIVILFTDAMMHNGPNTNWYPYASPLRIQAGRVQATTETAYRPISGNETFTSAHDAGDVTDSLVTFIGDSSSMSSDLDADLFSCLNTDGSPDAVVKFSLSQQRKIELATTGSHFDTVLGLFTGVPSDPMILPDSDNLNEDAMSSANLGALDGASVVISGDTTSMNANYDWSAIQCSGATGSPDAMYRFSLASDTRVSISTEGSTLDTVVGLYNGAPGLAPTYIASGDGNEDLDSATPMGEAYSSVLAYSGNTNNVGPDYMGAEVGCGADDLSPDAVYEFDLAQPTTVRISTEGSSFDSVLALVGSSCAAEPPTMPDPPQSGNSTATSGAEHTFAAGSFVIPMDTTYQNQGMLLAYGLVNELVRNDVPVSWVVKKNKAVGDADFTASGRDHVTTALVTDHGYRGGPFVVDVSDVSTATPIVDSWQSAHPSVNVHELTTQFTGFVRKQIVAAPRIAILGEGAPSVIRGYLAAAGIPASDGDASWSAGGPDVLSLAAVAGTSGDNDDGALFDSGGAPRFCDLATMGWTALSANTVTGRSAVAELRRFLNYPNHVFAQGESVVAIENNLNGLLLTQAGYFTGNAPSSYLLQNADYAFAQVDGSFASAGVTHPSFTLPQLDQYLDNDVVMISDESTPIGDSDLWVVGRPDGTCSIRNETCAVGQPAGKISYLGGNAYTTLTPITSNPLSNGTRLFLNSLFDSDCISERGRPLPSVTLFGAVSTQNQQETYDIAYLNDGDGVALEASLEYTVPTGATLVGATSGYTQVGDTLIWDLQALDYDEAGVVSITLEFNAFGAYANQAVLHYRQGVTPRTVTSWVLTTNYTALPDQSCTALGINNVSVNPDNENQTSAKQIGDLDGRIFVATGSTAGMDADYAGGDLGCNADSASPDAVFQFSLDQPRNVQIDTDGTSWDTVLGLYNGSIGANSSVTATNDNETTESPQAVGSVSGRSIVVTGGNTSTMTADYADAEVGCGPSASTDSPDAVYEFTVGAPGTTVKLDTYGSSFDTLLSLHDGPIVPPSISLDVTLSSNDNEDQDTAYAAHESVDGNRQTYYGDTSGMNPNYTLCRGHASSPDAVFEVDVTTAGTYEFDTFGTSFDTVLALYPSVIGVNDVDTVPVGDSDSNSVADDLANAYDVGVLDDRWKKFSGDTDHNGNDWTTANCGSSLWSEDAFYTFTLNSTRTVEIDLSGSRFDTVLHLYRFDDPGHTTYSLVECDDDGGTGRDSRIIRSLAAGDYFIVITGYDYSDEGDYEVEFKDTAALSENAIACNDDAGGSYQSQISQYLTPGNYKLVVKSYYWWASGPYELNIVDPNAGSGVGDPNQLECNNNASSTQQSEITRFLSAGTYYAVVKGTSSLANGSYKLTVQDVDNPPSSGFLECDDADGPDGTAQIVRSLPAGDYWVALKGTAASESGDYALTMRDQDAAVAIVLECDDDSGDNKTSVIERDLAPGTYRVVVKGDGQFDAGDYNLSVRDVSNQGFNLLACDQDSGPAQSSFIETELVAGDYYLMVKGDADSDAAPYTLTVQDSANNSLGAIDCDDDGSTYRTSRISRTLNPGTYYAAVKGYNATQSGQYQLTVGGATAVSSSYVPPTWTETRQALVDNEVRVMSVISCHDDPDYGSPGACDTTRSQAVTLANESLALGQNDQPLVFDIDRDGQGLSNSVIEGVASLANYLKMDVKVVIAFNPDSNPGFIATVSAIDEAGDGCGGLSGFEHLDCLPGATPKFQVSFENPLPGVPLNPDDPNGGYTFRAQLIGNDRFVIDEVPIYIIPDDVIPGPEPPIYEMGEYRQDASATGCEGFSNTRPDWRDLSWDGDVPTNTKVTFSACTAETPEELDSCTPHLIAEVSGAGACTTDADCPVGYCDPDVGACQIATAGSCADDAQCGLNSFCSTDLGKCVYQSQPVYIGPTLGAENYQTHLRMVIGMSVTAPYDDPPTLYSWELTYLCNNVL